jgi:hypothetical protein
MWTLIFDHHEGRTPMHGYEATREAAMAAFAKKLVAGVAQLKPTTEVEATSILPPRT